MVRKNFLKMSFLICFFFLIALNICTGAPSQHNAPLGDSNEAPLIFPEDSERYKIIIGSPHKTIVKREASSESPATQKPSSDPTVPLLNFPEDSSAYKIVKVNKTTGDEVPLYFPNNNCQYKIIEVNKSAGELPPDTFPIDPELYRIITINASNDKPALTLPTNTNGYKIIPVNSTAEEPEMLFPTDEVKFKIIQYNATVENPQQEFPTDMTKYRILKINHSCAEQPPMDFPTKTDISGAPLPLDIFPNSSEVKIINIASELPPLLFPDSNENYTIIEKNMTLIKTLTRPDNGKVSTKEIETSTDGKSSTEATKSSIENFDVTTQKPIVDEATPTPASTPEDSKTPEPQNINGDAEYIQSTHEEKETGLEEAYNKPTKKANEHHKPKTTGETWAILVGTFAGFFVLGCIGFTTWKQIKDRKYGTRERLITEESYYTTNDMRHFEL